MADVGGLSASGKRMAWVLVECQPDSVRHLRSFLSDHEGKCDSFRHGTPARPAQMDVCIPALHVESLRRLSYVMSVK